MKKYKLIKEYPGSPELGTVAEYKEEFLFYALNNSPTNRMLVEHIENSPEFWEEIIEEDYEILSFNWSGQIVTYRENKGTYIISTASDNDFPGFTLEEELSNLALGKCVIHSVKRLSDGEIFTIGNETKQGIIEKIIYRKNELSFYYEGNACGYTLDFQKKLKPLFTTEDGVDIFEGDSYVKVNPKYYSLVTGFVAEGGHKSHVGIFFSTKEAAEEYILLNKPSLSIQDLIKFQKSRGCLGDSLISFAKEFVKSKK